jgi:hypothetical protein
MPTALDLLTAVNEAILKRISGDAYESYSAHGKQFAGTPLSELYELRVHLQNEVNAQNGLSFGLAESFER